MGMQKRLSKAQRVIITIICFAVALVGFMLKLPATIRHVDKELHAAFYFAAAAFLNILFARRNLVYHVLIFVVLFLFGTAIEYAQAYSNRFFARRIHGRFDPEDVEWNLKGLVAFSAVWLIYTGLVTIYRKTRFKNTAPKPSKANRQQAVELVRAIDAVTVFGLRPNVQIPNANRYLEEGLVDLYRIYLKTDDVVDDEEYPEFDRSKLEKTRQHIASTFAGLGYYKKILDIEDLSNREDIATGDALDDLTDIINDMLEVKWRIEHNSPEDGLSYFKMIFKSHTQQHLLDLLNYLKRRGQ